MLFLLALLFFSLSTSVMALPMNQPHGFEHHPHFELLPIAYSITRGPAEVPSRYHGCWTPTIVSELCSFNITPFEPLIA
jgi:hypothetical protein